MIPAVEWCERGLIGTRPVPIISSAMHAHAASDQLAASLDLSALSAAAVVAVTVSIISVVIIRPSARGVLG
jgi:hypothetical protein